MSKATVLIVENEAIVAADLAGKLVRLGYEVAGEAARGEEAVALACRLRPNLVLMDISLPGPVDGIAATEAIRRQHDVPVIYLTAHADSATLARAKLTDPFGYILKPFEERELATQIELALYKHQADQQIRQQREWLRVTLTSIGDAVLATDNAGRITFASADSANSLGLLVQILGHEVRTAYDGPSALALAQAFRPEVVLLDIGMPGMNGYDVVRRLRQMPEVKDTLLVAQTGWGQEEDRQRTQEAGFDAHLTKPVDVAILKALLAEK